MTQTHTIQDQEELDQIKLVRDGYQPVFDQQAAFAESCLQLMGSNILGSEERKILTTKRGELDQTVSEIKKLCRNAGMELSFDMLEKEASRDFHNIFVGDVEEHKLKFVIFLKTYVLLKKLCVSLSQSWSQIQFIINQLEFSVHSEFRRQLLDYNVEPALRQCEILAVYCKRMAMILRLKKEPKSVRHLDGVAEYHPSIEYKHSTVYTENLEATLGILFSDQGQDQSQLPEARLETATRKKASPWERKNKHIEEYKLNASGTQAWNRTRDYYFEYDPRLLQRDLDLFQKAIYFDSHMGADAKFMRTNLILNITSKKQKAKDRNMAEEYKQFLNTFFHLVNEITLMNMSIPPELREAFFYHLGPQAYYNLTIKFLQEVNTGAIHCRIGKGRMVRKLIPTEFVKKAVLEFWKETVLAKIMFDVDDYSIFKQILTKVKAMHRLLLEKAQEEYLKLPESVRASRDRRELFKENASQWIGATNIVVFKRYLSAHK